VLNSNGLSWRPNLHILDACQSVQCAIELDYTSGKLLILNVGTDEDNLQIIDIAKIIQKFVLNCNLKFLIDNPELDTEELIRDRKVENGGDSRTYKVSFNKIKNIMPAFKCKWNVEKGVEDMIQLFERLPLSSEVFKSRGFYRLQHLEDLHSDGLVSDELFWLKPKES
jgi:dTDP-D-glucose 4,6-dehydratase